MKKVFAFVGSRRGQSSNSKTVLELLIDNISNNINEKVFYDIYYADNIKMLNCLGCCNCFEKGECVLDKKDKFNIIKEKMISSDFIIFVSPVYAHNVNGDMKVFIDRISSWFHLFRLAGKKSAVISVSSTNGNDFVNSYLKKILELAGTEVVSTVSVTIDGPCMLEDEEFLKESLPFIGKKIANAIIDTSFQTSREQEKFFLSMREMYKSIKEEYRNKSYEYKYWNTTGMLESESLKNFVLIKRQGLINNSKGKRT